MYQSQQPTETQKNCPDPLPPLPSALPLDLPLGSHFLAAVQTCIQWEQSGALVLFCSEQEFKGRRDMAIAHLWHKGNYISHYMYVNIYIYIYSYMNLYEHRR